MDSTTSIGMAKFRADSILAGFPHQERRAKSKQLKKDAAMRGTLYRMRKARWGDGYSPPSDTLLNIANVLGVTIDELYNK